MKLIDRTLEILLILSEYETGLSISDISKLLEIPISSTHRILKSLKKNRFVMQSPDNKMYLLGYRALLIGKNISKDDKLIEISKPLMKKLANKIKQTITLCKLEGENIECIYHIESQDTSVFLVRTGSSMPAHMTSAGQAIMAYTSKKYVSSIFNKAIDKKIGENSISSFNEFNSKLDGIKLKGYAVSDEELQQGVYGTAAPIFENGKIVAALSFTSLKSSKNLEEKEYEVNLLKKYAADISASIS